VGAGGNFVSLKGGIMQYNGAAMPENRMKAIVLDYVLENQFYEGVFDPDNFKAPSCYAFGTDPATMAPNPENVENPVNPTCHGCPNNEWGSAEVGKGKACKEVARLALITEGDLEDVENANVAYLKVPVTSMKNWAGLVRQLDDVYHKPPLAFITEISIVKENTNKLPGWHLDFKMVEAIEADPAAYEALWAKYEEVNRSIAFPYAKASETEEEAASPPRSRPATPRAQASRPAPRTVSRKVMAPPAPVVAASKTRVSARRPEKVAKY
jgi:hypothetical protein